MEKKNKKDVYGAMLACFLFFTMLHFLTTAYHSDDVMYKDMLNNMSLFAFLKHYYLEWSSRVIIDAVSYIVMLPMIVWKVIDVLLLLLLFYDMYIICCSNEKTPNPYIILGLMCCYPFKHMGSSGWIITTINYLWPFSIGMYVIANLCQMKNGKKQKWYHYIVLVIALIAGCANELMAVIILVSFIVAWFYFKAKEVKFSRVYLFGGMGISIASIIFILTCPGNENRMAQTVEQHMPNFYELSFWDKIKLNYIALFGHFVSQPNVILFLLCFVVLVGTIVATKNFKKRLIAMIPMMIDVTFTVGFFILQKLGLKEDDYLTPVLEYTANAEILEHILLFAAFTLLIVTLLLAIYWLVKDKVVYFEILLIIGLGVATRMALSFSPSMFISYTRIYMFLYFAIIMVIVLILENIELPRNSIFNKLLYAICFLGMCINVITVYNMNAAMK